MKTLTIYRYDNGTAVTLTTANTAGYGTTKAGVVAEFVSTINSTSG